MGKRYKSVLAMIWNMNLSSHFKLRFFRIMLVKRIKKWIGIKEDDVPPPKQPK